MEYLGKLSTVKSAEIRKIPEREKNISNQVWAEDI